MKRAKKKSGLFGNSKKNKENDINTALTTNNEEEIKSEPFSSEIPDADFNLEDNLENNISNDISPIPEAEEEEAFAVDDTSCDFTESSSETDVEQNESIIDDITNEPELSKKEKKEMKKKSKKGEKDKKKKKKKGLTISIIVIFFLVAVFAVLMGLDFTDNSSPDFDDVFVAPVEETGKINVLLLGVDKEGERSDSIMLVSYDFESHSTHLLSIPRDTRMYVEDRSLYRKITEVHGMHDKNGKLYGAGAVAEAVSTITGLPINYYVEFSFNALDNLMDILGPVEFDVPDIEGGGRGMNYDDPSQDLSIHLKPGLQELSGNQIQQFMRYRKSNNGGGDGSDISRVGRQQELIKAIVDQKVSLDLVLKVPGLFKEMKSQIKTNVSTKDVIKYAGCLKDISPSNMTSFVLPGGSATVGGVSYFLCDLAETAELVNAEFGGNVEENDLSTTISLTGKKATGKTKYDSYGTKNDTKSDSKKSTKNSKKSDSEETEKTVEKKPEKKAEEKQNDDSESTKTSDEKKNKTSNKKESDSVESATEESSKKTSKSSDSEKTSSANKNESVKSSQKVEENKEVYKPADEPKDTSQTTPSYNDTPKNEVPDNSVSVSEPSGISITDE